MAQIYCSTGAIIGRPNHRDFRLLEHLQKKLNCDGLEFMMYSTWYEEIEQIVGVLKGLRLPTPVYHCEKGIGEYISKNGAGDVQEALRRFRINCEMAENIGADKMVLHLWNGIASDRQFENNLRAYASLREIADAFGRELLIENVVCNRENPMKHLCELRERYPDVRFTFDTKMAAFHSELDLLYEADYAWLTRDGHIRHYHVNDYDGGHMEWEKLAVLAPGRGKVSLSEFLHFVKKTGYDDSFTIEATAFDDNGVVDTDMLNASVAFVREHFC